MAIPLRQTKLMGKGPLKVLHNGMKIYTNIEKYQRLVCLFFYFQVLPSRLLGLIMSSHILSCKRKIYFENLVPCLKEMKKARVKKKPFIWRFQVRQFKNRKDWIVDRQSRTKNSLLQALRNV